jgi:hypothetical protein
MSANIPKIGHAQDFLRRAVALNKVHNPDDPAHAYLEMDHAAWQAAPEKAKGRDAKVASELAIATVARHNIASLHHGYPHKAPVHEQAAYLLRGFAGLQPFAVASDLTGWDLVAETLEHHGFDLLAESEEGRALLHALWTRLQREHPGGFQREHLGAHDESFQWLAQWFRPRIVATGIKADVPT